MRVVAGITLGCAAIAAGYQLFQLFAAWWVLRGARGKAAQDVGSLPAVTILKPLKGLGVDLYDNLASFCCQDYPAEVQLVFGVEDPADPALEIVRRLRHDFPAVAMTIAIEQAPGANRKVANLCHMVRHARHDVFVLSDADIRVQRDYLRALVVPLADPRVGLTTCLYRGVATLGIPSTVEALSINTDFTPMVMSAQLIEPFEYAFGASIAVKRAALEQVGGFAAIANHLADDYELGHRMASVGIGLVLVPYVVDTVLDTEAFGDVWRHQVRWARTYRVCRPASWFATILTHATFWGIASLLVTGGTRAGWIAALGALGARLGGLAGILALLGDRDTARWLWLVPVKDLAATLVWGAAFLGRDVTWSGRRLRIASDGRLVPLGPSSTPVPQPAGGEAPHDGDRFAAASG